MAVKKRGRRKEKSKKPLIVGICVGVSIVLIGVAGYVILPKIFQKKLTAQEVVTTYFDKVAKHEYEDMYALISEEAQKSISKTDFVARNKKIYEGVEADKLKVKLATDNEDSKDTQKDGKTIVVYQTTMHTLAGEYSFENDIALAKNQDNEYKIQWNSAVIFPGLEDTYKVKVANTTAKRGTIYDRNKVPLATDGTVAQVGIVPGKLDSDRDGALAKIAEILGITKEEIEKELSASWVKDDVFVPVKKIKVDDEQIQSALVGKEGEDGIAGVAINNVADRIYSLGAAAGHLTGYVQSISAEELKEKSKDGYHENSVIGKSGLEKTYESELRPIDGVEIYMVDGEGTKKETLCFAPPQDGKDVVVTIDYKVQQNTYNQFSQDVGTAVAMNPKTGELLALVSTPGIDPNEFILGMSGTRWDAINSDIAQPLMNRFSNAWVPGSTFKAITAAAGVDTGKLDPAENKGNVGLAWQKDGSWGNYKVTTLTDYGSEVNLANALIYSDNIYFAKAALDIGADTLVEELKKFGFEEEIPIDLKLQASSYGVDGKIDNEIQLADSGYGQGKILVNPVHLASMYSLFVNEGNMILPTIKYSEEASPSYWKENVVTKETADLVKQDLIQVIENPRGTGASVKMEGVSLLGKTGTAETKSSQDESGAKEMGWFACETAEDTDKPIVVIAMVEDIQSKGVKHYVNDKVKNIIAGYLQ